MVGQMMGETLKKFPGLPEQKRFSICFESGANFSPESAAAYLLKDPKAIKVAQDTFEEKRLKPAAQYSATLPSFSEDSCAH